MIKMDNWNSVALKKIEELETKVRQLEQGQKGDVGKTIRQLWWALWIIAMFVIFMFAIIFGTWIG